MKSSEFSRKLVIFFGAMDSHVINVSSEVRVSLYLYLNASVSWLENPAKSYLSFHLATCVVLGLLSLTAAVLNLFLLIAIFLSNSLKKIVLNQLISYMSILCVLDCSTNIPISVYYMKTSSWLLGPVLCTINASLLLLIASFITWILCFMCLERYFSLHKLFQSKRCSLFCKQSVAMATLLIILSSLVVPIAVGSVEIRAFPSLYSCCITLNKGLYYRITVISSFVFPLFLSLSSLFLAYVKNFQGIKDINCQRIELSYTELFFEESHLWNEWQTSKFVGVVMILFLFLELPLIISVMKTSTVPLIATQLKDLEQQNSTFRVSYPIAQVTPSTDKIYFGGKFLFSLLFPLATLMLRKEIRRKIFILTSLCRTSSSIPDNTVESPTPQDACPDDFLVPQVWRRRRLSSVTSLKPPIIFGKTRRGSLQFMDLTTGIAKWKANYEDPKSNSKSDKPFFADVFDDEDELTEFVSFQDFTEEELNSSELTSVPCGSRDVAVQTTQGPARPEKTCYNISDVKVEYRCVYESRLGRPRCGRNRRLSKSFTCGRGNSQYVKCKYYMTFPKMSESPVSEFPESSTSDLLRALQITRASKTGITACALIPRGTGELLDSPVETKDIVSL